MTLSKNTLKQYRYREKMRLYLRTLRENPCLDCGIQYPFYVMDFDHTRGEKKFDIGRAIVNPVSKKRLEEELAKCDLLCANCHRTRTYKRANNIPE